MDELVGTALRLMRAERISAGDNVKALSEVSANADDMHIYLSLAKKLAGLSCADGTAPIAGLCAPAGGGKSTLVQILRLLLEKVLKIGQVVEVSLDDFLSSQQERKERQIRTRWDVHATNADLGSACLWALKRAQSADSVVELPCFSKGRDERLPEPRLVHGKVALIIFEGWRVGVDHPNFEPFNAPIDMLIYLKVDFDAIFNFKYECAKRDIATCGHDLYEQYGGFDEVFRRYYRRVADEFILPVEGWSDVVLVKDAHHHVGPPVWQHRWGAHKSAVRIEATHTVVAGGGQAGLCAAYSLAERGLPYILLERDAIGSTWESYRWDSFRLVTENSLCAMPNFPTTEVGHAPDGFMPRAEIASYLRAFAAKNSIAARKLTLLGVTRGWSGWVLRTRDESSGSIIWFQCAAVVMAVGGFHRPKLPAWAGDVPATIKTLHARDYKRVSELPPHGDVIVVGTAQSGSQIALELSEAGRRVYLCLSHTSFRVPRRVRGRDITWWLWKTGLYDTSVDQLTPVEVAKKRSSPNPSQAPARDLRFRELAHTRGLVYVGHGLGITPEGKLRVDASMVGATMEKIEGNVQAMRSLIQRHIDKHAIRDTSLRDLPPMEEEPHFERPRCETHPVEAIDLSTVSTVVFATGYSLDFESLIDVPNLSDDTGYPLQYRGVSKAATGLYFLGLPWLHKWQSVTLLGAAEDAEYVAAHIAQRATAFASQMGTPPAPAATAMVGPGSASPRVAPRTRLRASIYAVSKALKLRELRQSREHCLHRAWASRGDGAVGTMAGQLYGDDALAKPFVTWRDLLATTNGNADAIRAVPEAGMSGLTYARLAELLESHSTTLADLGIKRTDRLCSALPNGPESLTAFLAFSLACTYAPLNRALTEAELVFEFEDLPAKAVVVLRGDPNALRVRAVAERMHVAIIELLPSATEAGWFELAAVSVLSAVSAPSATRDDVCLVLHTSGTTNKPKLVPLTHANVATGALCIASTLQLRAAPHGDIALNVMPLFHIHGLSINVLASLLSGATVIASPGFDPDAFFTWAGTSIEPPTWYSAVPTMHLRVLQTAEERYASHGVYPEHSLTLLRNCSAALLPSVGARLQEVLGLHVMPTYAMTESMPIASNPRSDACDLRSVGFAAGPTARLMLEGDDGATACAVGEEGEVCVRGACVTTGYELREHMSADPNIAAFHVLHPAGVEERWLRTGDKGFVNADGYLTLVGRFKEIINRGGEKISPLEIENILRQHAAIRDLVVFAAPHTQLGEVPGAALVLRAGASITLQILRSHGLDGGLPVKWLPECIVLMEEIPKGPTGKPARIGLSERLGLPSLSDESGAEVGVMWDATGVIPDAAKAPIPMRPFAPALSPSCRTNRRSVDEDEQQQHLDEYLVTEAEVNHTVGEATLSLYGVRAAVCMHLRNALRREVAECIGLPVARINTEMSLATLGLESIAAAKLHTRVQNQLECKLPLRVLLGGSIAALAEHLSGLTTLGSPSQHATPPPAQTREVAAVDVTAGEAPSPQSQPTDPSYPMRPLQAAYLVGRELGGHGAWIYWETDLDDFDADRFNWAVQALVTRHEALRTAMSANGTQRVFEVEEVPPFALELRRPPEALTGSRTSGDDDEAALDDWLSRALQSVRQEATRWLPQSYPMFQIVGVAQSASRVRVAFLFDLLLTDAASLNVLSEELSTLYMAPSAETALALLPPVTCTHREHVLQRLAEAEAMPAAREREMAYWASKLAAVEDGGLPPAPNLPMSVQKSGGAHDLSRSSASLSKAQWTNFKAECFRRSITPTIGLLTAYASVISAYSSKHFTLTMANFSRGPGAERIVGNLADVMLVAVDFREQCSFEVAATRLASEVWTAVEHSNYTSGVEVMSQLNERDGTPNQAASPYVFASVLGASKEEEPAGAQEGQIDTSLFKWFGAVRPVRGSSALDTPQVYLDHQCFVDADGTLYYNWDYLQSAFPPGLIDTMFETYCAFIERLSNSHDAWLQPPKLVPETHVAQQLAIQLEEHRPDLIQKLEPLHAPFAELAVSHADKPAVSDRDGIITFSTLHRLATSTSEHLAELAGTSRMPVGVMIDKSCVQVVAVLSTLFAGRAYVPITLGQPGSRIRQILSAIEAAVVLTASGHALPADDMPGTIALELQLHADAPANGAPATFSSIVLEATRLPTRAPIQMTNEAPLYPLQRATSNELANIAYIIFTSGSTGVPKGVAIAHRGASNTCKDINERYAVGADDTVLSLASLAFDLSVYDLFGVLATGGHLAMPDPTLAKDPEHWLELLERQKVTVWNTAPPVMSMLLEWVQADPKAAARFSRLPLRVVMLSGDFCALWVPRLLHRLLPAENHPAVYSLGGATEASIWSCFYPVTTVPETWRSIPYGGPLANQTLYVLDSHLAIAPPLVPAQIVIGGVGLAEEYWRDEVKTSKSFVKAELHGRVERVYLTGDLGRYVRDELTGGSTIEMLGRLDFQVKIHGNRVEIGEVEAAMRTCKSAGAAVVLPAKLHGVQELVAFVEPDTAVPEAEAAAAYEQLKAAVVAAAAAALPPYMVPSVTYVVAKLPMSSNGKVDRKALLALHDEACAAKAEDESVGSSAEEPRTDSEARLHAVWQKVLNREGHPLNVFARFHADLSGTSLALTKMRIAVEEAFGVKVPLPVLFERETIVSLAEWLDDRGTATQQALPNVVCFQRSGSCPPLFCVAPVAGQVLCYKALAEALGPEQPFYALQSAGLNDGETPLESVEEIASSLVEQVLAITARFPRHQRHFHIGGWSMGGVVAFEMWLQLARRATMRAGPAAGGPPVGQLVLLDSPAPIGQMPTFTEAEMLLTFAADLTSCRGSLDLPSVDALAALDAPSRRDRILSRLEHVLPRSVLERTFSVYCANLRALSAYRPMVGAEAGLLRMHLVKASETNTHIRRYPGHAAVELGWTQTGLRPSQVILYVQGGDHYFVTNRDHLPAIARKLGQILDTEAFRSGGGHEAIMVVQSSSRFSRMASPFVARPPTLRSDEAIEPTVSRSPSLTATRTPLLRAPGEGGGGAFGGGGGGFRMASASSKKADWDRAVLDAYTELLKKLRVAPHVLIVTAKSTFPASGVASMLRNLAPHATVHATTSCRGCISSDGHHSFGLLGIVDPSGRYTTGMSGGATDATTARAAGEAAARAALAAAGNGRGEMPAVALVTGAPACEELVLSGIEHVLGDDVPIMGGSSADESFDGSWWAFGLSGGDAVRPTAETTCEPSNSAVVITLFWPSVKTKLVMSSAFQPTAARGHVTRANGRVVYEIDGEPAANVYAAWSDSADFRDKMRRVEAGGGAEGVLADTTLAPLGREQPLAGSGTCHTLVHPSRIVDGGGLECFATCEEGEVLVMMAAQHGTDTLVSHPTRVMDAPDMRDDPIRGCLIVYCAGCAMAIEERLQGVAQSFADSLGGGSVDGDGGGCPFLGMFTYGEQCRTPTGRNEHVNLMYAVLAFCE